MTEQSVCAVIVTYHPSAEMVENLSAIVMQVSGMVVVDNGSNLDALTALRAASLSLGFQLIENGENLGIAEALNQGVCWAKSSGYPWVILFDQDSRITDGFISSMFEAWERNPQRDRVASIQPRYVDPGTGTALSIYRALDGGPMTSMTSGTLMPVWIFDNIGMFASNYFIDLVDCEYSLRIRAAGYLLADSGQAALLHTAGSPKRITFLGFSFASSHHSVTRRYYISRNRVVVYRKYIRTFPRYVAYMMYMALCETFKCLIAEENRVRKMRNFFIGTWDGLTGKMGKREGL